MLKRMKDGNHENMNYLREYSKYSSLVFQMIVMVIAGIWGGIELDRLLHMKGPVFTIILTIITSFAAVYYLFRTLLKK